MKPNTAVLVVCVLLFASACTQSPQRLVDSGNRYHEKKKYQEASILYRKAIAKDKTFADAYYREGLNLLDQKNPAEAARFFRRAVDLNPNNTDAEIKLSEIYLTAYSYDQKKFRSLLPEVRDLTAKIRQRDPNDYHGIRLQALLYLVDKDMVKAREAFEEANRMQPYSHDVLPWLAQSYAADNQFEKAEALMRDMIAHDKTWANAYDFLFVQYTQRKRPADAEAVLRQRVENDPASDVARTNYANYLAQTGRHAQGEAEIRKVLSDTKAFPHGHRLVGDFYMHTDRFDQAAAQYKEGIDSDSKNKLNYQLHLIGALARQGMSNQAKRVEALNLAKKVAGEHPKDTAATDLYSSLLLNSATREDSDKVIGELKTLVQNNSGDPMLHLNLARAYYASNNTEKALPEALEAVRIRGALMPARVLAARIFEDRGQHGKALEQSGIVLDQFPQDAEARLVHARALASLKDTKAEPELQALVQQQPNYSDAVYQLGTLYLNQKQYDKANAQFQRLWEGLGREKQPDLRGFIGMQEVKLRQGHADQAIQSLADLAQKNPKQSSLRYTLANFQAEAGTSLPPDDPRRKSLLKSAEDNYRAVLQNAKTYEVLLRLGTLQRMQHQDQEALATFDEASKLNPGSAEPPLNRATLLESAGKKEQAREAYKQALGIDPDNLVALNNLAFMEAESNQNLDQAMTYAERAKKRMPNNPNVADTLGYVYFRKNLTDDAIREFQSAVKAEPANAAYRLHLAMALLKHGDKTGARREAESALRTADSGQQQKIKSFMSEIG